MPNARALLIASGNSQALQNIQKISIIYYFLMLYLLLPLLLERNERI